MFIVDVALEHTCAEFRARAAEGQITAAECDLLTDGAILLAARVEELAQDGLTELPPWAAAARTPAAARAGRPG